MIKYILKTYVLLPVPVQPLAGGLDPRAHGQGSGAWSGPRLLSPPSVWLSAPAVAISNTSNTTVKYTVEALLRGHPD